MYSTRPISILVVCFEIFGTLRHTLHYGRAICICQLPQDRFPWIKPSDVRSTTTLVVDEHARKDNEELLRRSREPTASATRGSRRKRAESYQRRTNKLMYIYNIMTA